MIGRHGSRPLRIAFIGAGTMAGHHLRALRRVTTAHSVVGVHDVRDVAAQAFARRAGARAYATVSDLLQQTRPDLVHICTPAGTHFEPARQALLAEPRRCSRSPGSGLCSSAPGTNCSGTRRSAS